MKVKIKDLKPNPFRDMENYPIDEKKVEDLSNSINETGFWDNVLARKKDGEIQIAYGHHRLITLRKIFKPEDEVDIPIKNISDSHMVKIMANENHQSWGTLPRVIDETVKVTKAYLENHPKEVERCLKRAKVSLGAFAEVGADIISRFLGKNWSESRIRYSLERLGLIAKEEAHENHLDKEAIEMFPTERSARNFVRGIKQVKNVTPEQQREAAKEIIKTSELGEASAKKAILKAKYKNDKKQEQTKLFEDFIQECRRDVERLNAKLTTLLEYQKELDSEYYRRTFERLDLLVCLKQLSEKSNLLLGGNKNAGTNKQLSGGTANLQ